MYTNGNYKKRKIQMPLEGVMNKKGVLLEIAGAIFILVMAVGGISALTLQKETLYVGHSETNMFYKYSECASYIDSLPPDKIAVFRSKEIAERSGMIFSTCSR